MARPTLEKAAKSGLRLVACTAAVFASYACSDRTPGDASIDGDPAAVGEAPASAPRWSGVAPNRSPADDSTAAAWRTLVEQALRGAEGTPGVWVAVSHPESGYWEAALGEAVADRRAATLADHGRIGSITKTFTATAVLQLVDEGALRMDATVGEIVPALAERFPVTGDLTVEELLGMESGLGDYANVPGAATGQAVLDPSRVWTAEDLVAAALGASDVQPAGTPGYSTTNYAILGRMLEAVTGRTVEEVVTGLARRAGLDDTALAPGADNAMPAPFSHGYIDPPALPELRRLSGEEVAAGTDVTEWSMSWGGAGGGMYSTIDELFDWTAGAMGTVLLPDTLGERRLRLDHALPEGPVYGLGILGLPGVDGWVGHSGQAIGWEALGMYEPKSGAAIAIMINSTSGLSNFYPVWFEIFGIGP